MQLPIGWIEVRVYPGGSPIREGISFPPEHSSCKSFISSSKTSDNI